MESRGPEDSKNVKTSQAYFFEGFISFFEDFSLTKIKTSKKTTWRNYVSKLKSSSKSKKVWDMIRKISGKNSSGPIKHLSKNHVKATNKKDIADLLAKTFSNNS